MNDANAKMDALKAQAIGCTACDLSETRANVVFGSGDPTTRLVIVAEGILHPDQLGITTEREIRPKRGHCEIVR